jgi:hypothetical protein
MFPLLIDKDMSIKYVVCIGKNYKQNATFREVHFELEIQAKRQVHFSTVEITCAVHISNYRAFGV